MDEPAKITIEVENPGDEDEVVGTLVMYAYEHEGEEKAVQLLCELAKHRGKVLSMLNTNAVEIVKRQG